MNVDKFSAQTFFYFFLILALLFLSPFGTALLTVNEELFVFLSFLVFFDLLGRTLMQGVASTADTKITGLALRQTALLKTKLVSAVQFRTLIQMLLRPAQFRHRLRQSFVRDLATLLSARQLEMTSSAVQAMLFAHKVAVRQELTMVRTIFAGGLVKSIVALRTKLLAPVETESQSLYLGFKPTFFTYVGSVLRPFSLSLNKYFFSFNNTSFA